MEFLIVLGLCLLIGGRRLLKYGVMFGLVLFVLLALVVHYG